MSPIRHLTRFDLTRFSTARRFASSSHEYKGSAFRTSDHPKIEANAKASAPASAIRVAAVLNTRVAFRLIKPELIRQRRWAGISISRIIEREQATSRRQPFAPDLRETNHQYAAIIGLRSQAGAILKCSSSVCRSPRAYRKNLDGLIAKFVAEGVLLAAEDALRNQQFRQQS
jgi:hypothetical protein